MRKTCAIYTLLFSFFVFSAIGCKKAESPYPSLVAQDAWSRVQTVAKDRFASSYDSLDLYYLGRASYEVDEFDLALEAIELYFRITTDEAISYEARVLALQLPHYTGRIEQGRLLEEAGMLTSELAGAYYQALLAEGQKEEANAIFARYLIDSIDAVGYAALLLQGGASRELLIPALQAISAQECVTLLADAPIEEYAPMVAVAIAELLESYGSAALSPQARYLQYESLWRLYSRAEMRVLANKYRSLSTQAAQGLDTDVSDD